jgi:hypothetical protein
MALEQRGELVSLTLGSGDGLYRVGGGGVLHSDLADGGELQRPTFGFKTWTGSLSVCTSHSYASSIAPSGSENRAGWLPKVHRVPQLGRKSEHNQPLYMGVLVPTRRGFGILTILS